MAKFCGNCGAASDDNANVCGNCGAPFAAAKSGAGNILSKIPGVNDINIKPEQKALIMKIAKIAVPAVAALALVLIIVFCAIVPNTGAQGAVKKYFKALEKGDASAIVAMLPAKFTSEDIHGEKYDAEEIIAEYFDDERKVDDKEYSDIEDKYGEGYKYKIKDVKVKKLDKSDLADMVKDQYNAYEDACEEADKDFSAPEVKQGYRIKFELVLKGDDREKDATCTMYMVKEEGKWVIWDMSTTVPGAMEPLQYFFNNEIEAED